jgi:hypothetical protein
MATIEKNGAAARTVPTPAGRSPAEPYYYEDTPRGAGWVTFSAIVLGFAGVFGFIEGILAISSSKVYTANATYVFSNLHTWGWIVTILGALAMVSAVALFSGSELARWFGIFVASLNGIGQLMFVHANPWWSVSMFAIDILVIYGLATYAGARFRQE